MPTTQPGEHQRLGEDSQGRTHTVYKTKAGKKILKVCVNGRWFSRK